MLKLMMLVLLLACLVPSDAQETNGITVGVRIMSKGIATEPTLETVLGGAIELALKKNKYNAMQAKPGAASGSIVEFELDVGYILNGNRVSLTFSIVDTRGMMKSETLAVEHNLDPQFDQTVGASVKALMAAVEKELKIHPRAMAAMPAPTAEAAPKDAAPVVSVPDATPVPESGQAPMVTRLPSQLGMGPGGFVPMGRAADYFTAAFQFQADFDFPIGSSRRWRAGVQAGLITFSIEGADQVRMGSMFAMLGGGAAYTIASLGIFSPYLAVASGVTAAFIQGAGSVSYTELMPFGTAGLGTRIQLAGSFALKFEAVSIAILDLGAGGIDPFWGIMPRLAATLEL